MSSPKPSIFSSAPVLILESLSLDGVVQSALKPKLLVLSLIGSQLHAEEIAARIEAGMVYLDGATENPEAAPWRLRNVEQRAQVG